MAASLIKVRRSGTLGWYCVYNVPTIICTNDWAKARMDGELHDWIKENSVHFEVKDFLYNKPANKNKT